MSSCTVESLISFIRENSADCAIAGKANKRSDEYIRCAIDFAVQAVVANKSDDFQEAVDIKLENGECVQSACDKCSGIVDIVGNVNGACDDPIKENPEENEKNSYYSRIYGGLCSSDSENDAYSISKFRILGDGGCQFKVEPVVPDTGDYYAKILCVTLPDLSSGALPAVLCRYFYLVAAQALFWIYTYEADPAMQIKAVTFLNAYEKFLTLQRDVDRDVFVESIKFGTRVDTDEQ